MLGGGLLPPLVLNAGLHFRPHLHTQFIVGLPCTIGSGRAAVPNPYPRPYQGLVTTMAPLVQAITKAPK